MRKCESHFSLSKSINAVNFTASFLSPQIQLSYHLIRYSILIVATLLLQNMNDALEYNMETL